jgi:hypothetical protein
MWCSHAQAPLRGQVDLVPSRGAENTVPGLCATSERSSFVQRQLEALLSGRDVADSSTMAAAGLATPGFNVTVRRFRNPLIATAPALAVLDCGAHVEQEKAGAGLRGSSSGSSSRAALGVTGAPGSRMMMPAGSSWSVMTPCTLLYPAGRTSTAAADGEVTSLTAQLPASRFTHHPAATTLDAADAVQECAALTRQGRAGLRESDINVDIAQLLDSLGAYVNAPMHTPAGAAAVNSSTHHVRDSSSGMHCDERKPMAPGHPALALGPALAAACEEQEEGYASAGASDCGEMSPQLSELSALANPVAWADTLRERMEASLAACSSRGILPAPLDPLDHGNHGSAEGGGAAHGQLGLQSLPQRATAALDEYLRDHEQLRRRATRLQAAAISAAQLHAAG